MGEYESDSRSSIHAGFQLLLKLESLTLACPARRRGPWPAELGPGTAVAGIGLAFCWFRLSNQAREGIVAGPNVNVRE